MKRLYILLPLLLIFIFGTTKSVDAWSTADETVGNFFHTLGFPVKPNTTYNVFINPNVPAQGGIANLDNLRHNINGENSSIRFRDINFQNLGEITTVNVFSIEGPSFRPVGFGTFTTPPNTAWIIVRLGTISTTTSTPNQANERNNLYGNFTIFESSDVNSIIISGSSVQINQAYADGFARGLANATGTGVNAVTAFIPQMLGVTFAFFFQILSFQVFGVSALTILGTLLALSIGILTFKLFFGR